MRPPKKLLAQLEDLERQVGEAHERVRAEEQAQAIAKAEAVRASEALVEHYAGEVDEKSVAKLVAAKSKAEAVAAEPWAERIAGAQRAAQRLEVARDVWRGENIGGLLRELAPDATAAANAITTKIAELEQARRDWHEVAHRASRLIANLPGWNPRAIPGTDTMDGAIRSLRRDVGEVRVPLPRDLSISIAPEHDPDPAISGPARARIEAETRRRDAAAAARANEQAVQNEAAQAKAAS